MIKLQMCLPSPYRYNGFSYYAPSYRSLPSLSLRGNIRHKFDTKKLKDDDFEKKEERKKEEVDLIVTFSKPPPMPRFLGRSFFFRSGKHGPMITENLSI
ncbi:hypothetical protein OSB04_031558 [Centaurea solstitialis]|uniref:Uncharacterized protein n=1 Tax=Centaurea solstitialis TaxID=347529 RepID=A0AA38SMD6_9ASTR|nr:hypothetical protein OSB04_031558 [Centaurea solstitialis]